jgi:hypothetical protein
MYSSEYDLDSDEGSIELYSGPQSLIDVGSDMSSQLPSSCGSFDTVIDKSESEARDEVFDKSQDDSEDSQKSFIKNSSNTSSFDISPNEKVGEKCSFGGEKCEELDDYAEKTMPLRSIPIIHFPCDFDDESVGLLIVVTNTV